MIYDDLFTSQIEFHSVPDMNCFYYAFTYFVPVGVIEEMENCDHSICLGWSILLLYTPANKVWPLKSLSSS